MRNPRSPMEIVLWNGGPVSKEYPFFMTILPDDLDYFRENLPKSTTFEKQNEYILVTVTEIADEK